MEKIKRTHVYVMPPQSYEISGWPVEPSHQVDWSEYEKHLWCFGCEKDFIPENDGIFGGPIPIGAMTMLGISLDRINIKTHEVVKNPYAQAVLEKREVTEEEIERFRATWAK